MRGKSEGSKDTITKEHFLENAVGECPEVDIRIGDVPLRCLLDTGSNVSTLTESFFRDHLHGEEGDMHYTAKWLKLTAANKLPLPYLGYVELEVQVMGLTIPECGFLIIKDDDTSEPDSSLPGIVGMNIAKRCRQLILSEFDTAIRGELDSGWREACSRVQEAELVEKMSTARVAGKHKVYVPASSVATVYARGRKMQFKGEATMLLEPGNTPLPGGLIVVPTVISSNNHIFPVQVVNFSAEDVWLSPKIRLGILNQCQCVEGDPYEVKFQRISADHEEVTINQKDRQESDSDTQTLLDRLHLGGTPEQQAALRAVLMKYADVFADSDEDLGYTDRVKHGIPVVDETPVSQP